MSFEEKLKMTLDYLYDGNPQTVAPLYFVVNNYKRHIKMLNWLVKNEIRGNKLVDFFKNESPDGGGYHCGASLILSRMDGVKYNVNMVIANELR